MLIYFIYHPLTNFTSSLHKGNEFIFWLNLYGSPVNALIRVLLEKAFLLTVINTRLSCVSVLCFVIIIVLFVLILDFLGLCTARLGNLLPVPSDISCSKQLGGVMNMVRNSHVIDSTCMKNGRKKEV